MKIVNLMSRWSGLTAFALGLVSATGFAPLNLWPLTLICLAAWMHLVWKADSLKSALARGYAFGLGHFIVGLNWIAGAFAYQDAMPVWLGWIAVVALSIYIAVYPAMAAGLAWRWGRAPTATGPKPVIASSAPAGRGNPYDDAAAPPPHGLLRFARNDGKWPGTFVFFFAAAWVVTEWLRATMFTGFAWNPLAAISADAWPMIWATRWIGSYGFAALILIASSYLWLGTTLERVFLGIIMLVMVLFSVNDELFVPSAGTLIRIVQPNIGQQDKYEPGYDRINFDKLKRLTGAPGAEPRLILWPEAAIPDYLDEKDFDARFGRERIQQLMGPHDVILTGGVKREFEVTRRKGYVEHDLVGARNNVWGMDAQGHLLWRYDKSHLVPYGEYLPMKPILSAIGLSRLVPGDIDFWPGPGPRSYDVPGFAKVGVQVCYEIIFSGEVIDRNNRPAFLFNPSNDAWFGAWGPPQHLAQARLRAIEEGIPVVRATPTGISAVIDADGRVLKSIPLGKAGFIETRLPPAHQPTLFARYGNILPFGLAIFLVAIGVALRRKHR